MNSEKTFDDLRIPRTYSVDTWDHSGPSRPAPKLRPIRYGKPGRIGGYIHLEIKGQPYVAHRIEGGYAVTATDQNTSRLYRNYTVSCDASGNPQSCTCPDHFYRGGICKHMKAIAEISGGETGGGYVGEEEAGERGGPEAPERKTPPPTQLSRARRAVRRYAEYERPQVVPGQSSGDYNDRHFHQTMENDPNEQTHRLIYADWLDEQDRPGQANMERTNGKTDGATIMRKWIPERNIKSVRISYRSSYNGPSAKDGIVVSYPSLNNPEVFHHIYKWIHPFETSEVLQNLRKEGFHATGSATELKDHEQMENLETRFGTKPESPSRNRRMKRATYAVTRLPIKYEAFSSPKGAMVIGYNGYKGGQRIPSKNGGEFIKASMSPPKFNPVRMAAARKKLRGKFPQAIVVRHVPDASAQNN